MDFEHKKFGKCKIADITQGQAEKFSLAMRDADASNMPLIVWNRLALISAIDAGILLEPKLSKEEVEASNPGLIKWLAQCVAEAFAEATSTDPLS